jgi:DNA-binding SARP family transcriptional activator
VEFRILGPLEIAVGTGRLTLGRARDQKVLVALLLDANRVVPVDRLVDAVWDDNPPDTATKQIRNCVSDLRQRLAAAGAPHGVITTEPAGYVLHIEPEQLDARVFADRAAYGRRLARAGAPGDAAAALRAALEIWRGPALAGIGGRRITAAAARLDEQRLDTLEERMAAELAGGRAAELVAELVELVGEHPLRERLRGQLMLALYRSGRRADALDVYRQGRRLLVEELGLEPGAELRELEQAIITGDRRLAGTGTAAPAPPAQLPSDVAAFTGRAEPLDQLDALAGRNGERPARVVISAMAGAAGVGKTALAVHWAHRVRTRFPDGQLYVNLRGYAAGPPMRPIDALALFLRALGVPAERVPVDVEEAAAVYRSLLSDRRILVVLDNAASAAQVRPLLPGGAGCVVLVTSRDRLAGLVARDGAHLLSLDVLTPTESYTLLARTVGEDRVAAEPDAGRELARLCAHLPLALRIASAHLAARPGRRIAGYVAELAAGNRVAALTVEGDDQAAVQAAFDLSYATLAPGVRLLFRRLGLVPGPDVTVEAAAALAGTTVAEAAAGLDRLVAAHLVTESSGRLDLRSAQNPGSESSGRLDLRSAQNPGSGAWSGEGRFTFHDLLRQYAAERARAEDGEPACRAALDRLLHWYLRTVDAAAGLLYPEILRLPAADAGRSGATVADAPATFDDHAAALAWLDAERANLVAAAVHAADHGPRPVGWRLADALRGYFHLRMVTVDWLAVARAGLAAAEMDADGRGAGAGQAAARLSLGDLHWRLSRYPEAIEHYAAAATLAEAAAWPQGQAAVHGNLGNVYQQSGRLTQAAAEYRQALDIAEETGWARLEAANLDNLAAVHWELGRLAEAADYSVRALAIIRRAGSGFAEAVDLTNLGEVYHAQGRLDLAREQLDRALTLHREIGNRGGEAETLRLLAAVDRDSGRPAEALDLARAALALAREAGDRRYEADALNTVASIDAVRGRWAAAADGHREALALAREIGNRYPEAEALIGLAVAGRQLGRLDEARRHATEALLVARQVGYRILEGQAFAAAADIDRAAGRDDDAARNAGQALAIRRETGHRPFQPEAKYSAPASTSQSAR